MDIKKQFKLINSSDLLSNTTNTTMYTDSFFRIGYYLELQSSLFGNQWIFTEFDAFSSEISDYLIPSSKIIKRNVNNLSIKSSSGMNITQLDNGAAVGCLPGRSPGVVNPYMHWAAIDVITPSDFMKSSKQSSCHESAYAGCSIEPSKT